MAPTPHAEPAPRLRLPRLHRSAARPRVKCLPASVQELVQGRGLLAFCWDGGSPSGYTTVGGAGSEGGANSSLLAICSPGGGGHGGRQGDASALVGDIGPRRIWPQHLWNGSTYQVRAHSSAGLAKRWTSCAARHAVPPAPPPAQPHVAAAGDAERASDGRGACHAPRRDLSRRAPPHARRRPRGASGEARGTCGRWDRQRGVGYRWRVWHRRRVWRSKADLWGIRRHRRRVRRRSRGAGDRRGASGHGRGRGGRRARSRPSLHS